LEKYDEAIECFEKDIEIDPNLAYAWYNKGHILGRLERLDDAIECFSKSLKIDPINADAWNSKGYPQV
jgi:tetratricopeptide (TPR) repeat protein